MACLLVVLEAVIVGVVKQFSPFVRTCPWVGWIGVSVRSSSFWVRADMGTNSGACGSSVVLVIGVWTVICGSVEGDVLCSSSLSVVC